MVGKLNPVKSIVNLNKEPAIISLNKCGNDSIVKKNYLTSNLYFLILIEKPSVSNIPLYRRNSLSCKSSVITEFNSAMVNINGNNNIANLKNEQITTNNFRPIVLPSINPYNG